MRIQALFIIVFSLMLITGCRTVMVVPAASHTTVVHAHPPHAPAHGYRHHYHGRDMEYDSNLDAYIVLGFDGVYFYNDFYLRFYAGDWQEVDRLDGRWRRAEHRHVPGKLRSHKRYNRYERYEHPPVAPRHGYRHHHHHGVDLVFDSDIGVYMVLGFDGLFYFDNLYLRFYDGYWHAADRHDGHWRRAEHRHVPRGLWRHKSYQRQLRHTPPPHAPAHGYRHHHQHGVDLVFDSGIGAYVVLGFDDLFFLDGFYMRFYDNRWHIADRYDGRWRSADDRHIPRKLRGQRSSEKQGLFKRIKNQYREEHRQEREYRERYYRDKNGNGRPDHRRDDNYRDRDRDRDRDGSSRRENESKKGLFSKLKKKHEEEENRKNSRNRDRDGEIDEEDNDDRDDRRERRDNGYRF